MNTVITSNTVLGRTSWCVIREQEVQWLIYNSKTDELHLLQPTGYFVLKLCNGTDTAAQIESELTDKIPIGTAQVRKALYDFLGKLLERGLVEVRQNG